MVPFYVAVTGPFLLDRLHKASLWPPLPPEQVLCPCLGDYDLLYRNELGLKAGFPIFQEHLYHLSEVAIEFIEGLALRMCPWKARDIPDAKAGVRLPLNDCCKL